MASEVYVDSGHGDADPGATGNGVVERDRNAEICRYVVERLRALGVPTRTDLEAGNPKAAGSVDLSHTFRDIVLFWSCHLNAAASTSARGYEVYGTGSGRSWGLARALHDAHMKVLREMDPAYLDRGVKQASGTRAEYTVVKSNGAAALSEAGFLSNVQDATVIRREDFVARYGEATVQAIVEFGRSEGLWPQRYQPPGELVVYDVPIPGPTKSFESQDLAIGVLRQYLEKRPVGSVVGIRKRVVK